MNEEEIKNVFDNVWKSDSDRKRWDYLSELILNSLKERTGSFKNKKMLEVGSGSGRISLLLGTLGAKPFLLDISPEAISMGRKFSDDLKVKSQFIIASMFSIPFSRESFDIVWNAGVIEHYKEDKQIIAVSQMLDVCSKDGLVITLNPSNRSIIYKLGKLFLEKTGRWQYGYVKPIQTLSRVAKKSDAILVDEYSEGFFILFSESFRRLLPFFGYRISDALGSFFIKLHRGSFGRKITKLDRLMSEIFGGYLLVSVLKRK